MQHAENDSKPKSVKGTVEYLAPEVVLCSYLRQYDACQSDVWSCGVILYLMLCILYPMLSSCFLSYLITYLMLCILYLMLCILSTSCCVSSTSCCASSAS